MNGDPARIASSTTTFPAQPDGAVRDLRPELPGQAGEHFRVYWHEQGERADVLGGAASCTDDPNTYWKSTASCAALSEPDNDGDGQGDSFDTDDDNDGQTDADELLAGSDPFDPVSKGLDFDGDNRPDAARSG